MFKGITSKCAVFTTSLKSSDGDPVSEFADSAVARIRTNTLMNNRLWRIFRMAGYVVLCLGSGVAGVLAAIGVLLIVFIAMWPFYLLGTFADALTSWIGTLVGLRNLWSPICHLIAISPAIIILRLVLPLWWRLISLRIVKKQPLEGELSCIN